MFTKTAPLGLPLDLAEGLTLKNRIVMASLTRDRAVRVQGQPRLNSHVVEHYRQRARGDFGLILSEGALVEQQGTVWPDAPGIWSAEQTADWKEVTEAVHEEGSLIFCQLWHTGRIANDNTEQQKLAGHSIRSPSTLPPARGNKHRSLEGKPGHSPSKEMTVAQIQEVVEAFRVGARNAKEAGFDGVELHHAQGYLLHQFIDPSVNKRTDDYGGDVQNRLRFTREVFAAILETWSPDRVGIKISPSTGINDIGVDAETTVEIFGALLALVSDLHLSYVQPVRYNEMMDPKYPPPGPEPEGARRSLCPDLDVERLLIQPFVEAQKQDGRARRTLVFWNGAFGGEKEEGFGVEAAEWIRRGRSDAIVFGVDALTNPDLGFRLLRGIPVQLPGGGNPKNWYADHSGEVGKNYTDYPFCDELLKEKGGLGRVRIRAH